MITTFSCTVGWFIYFFVSFGPFLAFFLTIFFPLVAAVADFFACASASVAVAVVSAAVALTMSKDGVCEKAKVVLGAVAPTVKIVNDASNVLIGSRLDQNTIKEMSQFCIDSCSPISDKRGTVEFRTDVAGVLAARAAKKAYSRAGF